MNFLAPGETFNIERSTSNNAQPPTSNFLTIPPLSFLGS
jgi:hypothetical protein